METLLNKAGFVASGYAEIDPQFQDVMEGRSGTVCASDRRRRTGAGNGDHSQEVPQQGDGEAVPPRSQEGQHHVSPILSYMYNDWDRNYESFYVVETQIFEQIRVLFHFEVCM